MKPEEPREIRAYTEEIRWSLEGDLSEAISFLQKAQTRLKREGYNRIHLNIDEERGYYDSCNAQVSLHCYRLENAEEVAARIARDEQEAENRRRYARQQLEQLKRELGEA